MKQESAVEAAIELAVDEKLEEMRQAEAHRYHWDSKGWCVWCRRGRT